MKVLGKTDTEFLLNTFMNYVFSVHSQRATEDNFAFQKQTAGYQFESSCQP